MAITFLGNSVYVKTVPELDSVHPHESFAGHVKAVWDVTVLPCAGLSRALRGVSHAWSPPTYSRSTLSVFGRTENALRNAQNVPFTPQS